LTTGTLAGAVMAGLSAALAVLIRPNLAPLVAIPILWFAYRAYTDSSERRRDFWKALGFGLACLPGIVITAVLNNWWYGSPFTSGYGPLAGIFSLKDFLPNAFNYAGLLSATETPLAFFGVVALLVPSAWLWGEGARRSLVVPMGFFVLAVFFEYCAYATFGAWWDLRFLLPAWSFMTMGMAVVVVKLSESLLGRGAVFDRVLIFVSSAIVIALGWHGLQYARQKGTFEQQQWEAKYQRAGTMVAERTDANSVIFAGLYSGSVRYYAGRVTLTYFKLDPDWLDRAVAWFDTQGIHPYALLEPFEIDEFKSKFSSKNTLGGLPMKPSAIIDGSTKIYFFDLQRGSDMLQTTETISEQPLGARCIGPATPPSLTLRSPER